MSLFDDASLAMIPSAYKDGKLYSIKPTDGSGDFTFTRGSNLAATRVDVNGLIEKGRENLFLQSNQFDTTWFAVNGSATLTSGQSGYDGSNNAWELEKNAASVGIRQNISLSGVQTFSIYAKAGTLNWIAFENSGSYGWFDLVNGVAGTNTFGNVNFESIGNGWWRISVFDNLSNARYSVYPSPSNNSLSGTSGSIYIQDAQLELGLVATDYIETTTTTAQAGILEDMPRLDYSGGASCPSLLLEPQRTNLITQSELFSDAYWTKSGSSVVSGFASPSGELNAFKLVEDSANSQHYLQRNFLSTSGSSYTYKIYVKMNGRKNIALRENGSTGYYVSFDLLNGVILQESNATGTIKELTDGWFEITHTSVAGVSFNVAYYLLSDSYVSGNPQTSPYQGDAVSGFYIYGAQLEQGSYPTSYIPTYGTSQTRSDDFMNISSLADEIDGNSFTYFLEINNEAVVRDSATGNISVGASGNRFFLYNDSSATARMKLYIQDVTTQSYQLSADNVKLVVRIEPNKVEVFENGVSVLSTTQNLDFSGNSSYVLRGATREMGIKQTAIFPTPLTDSECIALTTL